MTEMLTIKQTAERLKTIHPDTPISEHTLVLSLCYGRAQDPAFVGKCLQVFERRQ